MGGGLVVVQNHTETVVQCLRSNELPLSGTELLQGFLSEDGTKFISEESTYWDYKKEFPFSLKGDDQYFAGIVRLVSAFHNTFGGLIVFGVHDTDRTAGHNKVKIDIERFNSRLREVLTKPVECQYRRYVLSASESTKTEEKDRTVDVVLVPKRRAGPLVRPTITYRSASAGQVWVRHGAEVVEADSSDFTWLYGPRNDFGMDQEIPDSRIDAILPPSPSTIRKFIGRSEVLDRLFQWMLLDDNEPRVFLYGSGGSGKSTIAYEFARMVQLYGKELIPADGIAIDRVLYFSAKERSLDSASAKVYQDPLTDFSTKRELFEWIVKFSDDENNDLSSLSDAALLQRIRTILDNQRLLIVIDDIDTLLTKGEAAGLDDLYKVAIRGRVGAKLLYTQRPLPSLSRENAIEVPGLHHNNQKTSEYYRFVEACCAQFSLSIPRSEFIDGPLNIATERRPLVVETVLGMKRSCASYDEALNLFKNAAGDDARAYLFEREYNRLNTDNRSRYLLAALALMSRPVTFDELQTILKFDDNQLRDTISEIRDMFLSPNPDQEITTFAISTVAREFVSRKSASLDRYAFVKERVSYLNKKHLIDPPELRVVRLKVGDAQRKGNYSSAWTAVDDQNLPEKLRQHPYFLALKGEVAANYKPPKITEAREAFEDCVRFNHLDLGYLRTWYWMELNSGHGIQHAEKVCSLVLENKKFDLAAKAEFRARLGAVLFRRARETDTLNPGDAINDYRQAATHHIRAYSDLFYSRMDITKNAEFVTKTLFILLNFLRRTGEIHAFIDFFSEMNKSEKSASVRTAIMMDAATDPLIECVRRLPDNAKTAGQISRAKGSLSRLEQALQQPSGVLTFHDPDHKDKVLGNIAQSIRILKNS